MIKHLKTDDGVSGIVAWVSTGLWCRYWEVKMNVSLALSRLAWVWAGQFITWSLNFSLKVVCDPQWRLIVKICRIVNWTMVTNQRQVLWSRDQYWPIRGQYLLGHDLNLAIVPALMGLSAWLASENGKKFDQSEASMRVLTNQRTCWPSWSQINERLPSPASWQWFFQLETENCFNALLGTWSQANLAI